MNEEDKIKGLDPVPEDGQAEKESELIGSKTVPFDDDGKLNEAELARAQAQGLRVCDFCGKIFTNGKALGGHRRYHLQALKNQVKNKTQLVSSKIKSNYNHNLKFKIASTSNKKSCSDDDDHHHVDDHVRSMHALMTSGKPTCRVCKKTFPTMKSLYGHMRSHPEREWRGMHQPSPSQSTYSSSSISDSIDQQNVDEDDLDMVDSGIISRGTAIDLLESLSNWQKTDKRGRKCIGDAEGAENLILLSRGDYLSLKLPPQDDGDAIEANNDSELSFPYKKRKFDCSPTGKQKVKKIKVYSSLKLGNKVDEAGAGANDGLVEGKALLGSGFDKVVANMDDIDDDVKEDEISWAKEEMEKKIDHTHEHSKRNILKIKKNKNKILKTKSQDAESEDPSLLIKTLKSPPGAYKCRICSKSFTTFQALGGHRSSHNKEKRMSQDAKVVEEKGCANSPGLQIDDESKENEISESMILEETKHECKICNVRSFATAQALVDHYITHCSRGGGASMSEVTSAGEASQSGPKQGLSGEASQQSGPKVFDIDLNEPFVMEDGGVDSAFYQP
ncbi:Zinc finger protein [Quillaja saponaria]|uniref:Zinc finger protein n=1 Tax=Quillaja saponaria TaxID=32244 RepID=A0AAD7LNB4_QUISA|nr:Zinc finger protein [Quillaja saponaria]